MKELADYIERRIKEYTELTKNPKDQAEGIYNQGIISGLQCALIELLRINLKKNTP